MPKLRPIIFLLILVIAGCAVAQPYTIYETEPGGSNKQQILLMNNEVLDLGGTLGNSAVTLRRIDPAGRYIGTLTYFSDTEGGEIQSHVLEKDGQVVFFGQYIYQPNQFDYQLGFFALRYNPWDQSAQEVRVTQYVPKIDYAVRRNEGGFVGIDPAGANEGNSLIFVSDQLTLVEVDPLPIPESERVVGMIRHPYGGWAIPSRESIPNVGTVNRLYRIGLDQNIHSVSDPDTTESALAYNLLRDSELIYLIVATTGGSGYNTRVYEYNFNSSLQQAIDLDGFAVRKVEQLEDGGFLLAGRIGTQPVIRRVDNNWVTVWEDTFDSDLPVPWNVQLHNREDGSFLFSHDRVSDTYKMNWMSLVPLDPPAQVYLYLEQPWDNLYPGYETLKYSTHAINIGDETLNGTLTLTLRDEFGGEEVLQEEDFYLTTWGNNQVEQIQREYTVPNELVYGYYDIVVNVEAPEGTPIASDTLAFSYQASDLPEPNDPTPAQQPQEFALQSVYPNPFNAQATASLTLPSPGQLTVNVYTVTGQQVATLANGYYPAGHHEFTLDAQNWAAGVYFVRARFPGHIPQVNKIVLLK